jgi:hypothetical protein
MNRDDTRSSGNRGQPRHAAGLSHFSLAISGDARRRIVFGQQDAAHGFRAPIFASMNVADFLLGALDEVRTAVLAA